MRNRQGATGSGHSAIARSWVRVPRLCGGASRRCLTHLDSRNRPGAGATIFMLALSRPESAMPQGDKSAYTDKQKRKAAHIEESYEERGVGEAEAERRAWATVNKDSGGGNKSGSGRGQPDTHAAAKKRGKKGGEASAARSAAERSESAKKAAATRKRNAE